jgi:hypothetical protein
LYHANLSLDFALSVADDAATRYRIKQSVGNDLSITVGEPLVGHVDGLMRFNLTVMPKDSWSLPDRRIIGQATGSSYTALTVLWKSIERALITSRMKADLVQLLGYYQYPSEIICTLEAEVGDGDIMRRILESVTQGVGTRAVLCTSAFAEIWGVDVVHVDSIMRSLRGLGYEVRNHNTNQQIVPDDWSVHMNSLH